METITNLLEELVIFLVVGTWATQPDNVKNRAQVLWMAPKNDYFFFINSNVASFLAIMNERGRKSSEFCTPPLKNFDSTGVLKLFTQIGLSATMLHCIICIVDAHEPFGLKSYFSYGVWRAS